MKGNYISKNWNICNPKKNTQLYPSRTFCIIKKSKMTAIQRTLNRLSSTSLESTQNTIPPNRMTSAFNKMKEVCPDVISLYATCVTNHYNMGSLEKDCCAKEFAAVKKCFRSVRWSCYFFVWLIFEDGSFVMDALLEFPYGDKTMVNQPTNYQCLAE